MKIKSFNDAINRIEEYIELEIAFGGDEIECDRSIFKNLKSDTNTEIDFLSYGNQSQSDLLFIGVKKYKQQNIFEEDDGKLLKKIISAMKYKENNVSVLMFDIEEKIKSDEHDLNIRKVVEDELLKIKPKFIITLGHQIINLFDHQNKTEDKLFEKPMVFQDIPMLAIYDLNYMIKNPESKKDSWRILKIVLENLKNN